MTVSDSVQIEGAKMIYDLILHNTKLQLVSSGPSGPACLFRFETQQRSYGHTATTRQANKAGELNQTVPSVVAH